MSLLLCGRCAWWGAFGLVGVALLAPLASVDVPPLLDYPNHLARAVVLSVGSSDKVLSQMFAPDWAIIPNIGTDLVLPPLLHVLPVHVAGRVVIGSVILLPVFGTVAYSHAVFGVRSVWPLASALVAYNGTLLLGFLNFLAGAGLALLLAAVWIKWREAYPRRVIAFAAIGVVALFFCHLMSVAFCAILIGGYEAEWLWHHRADTVAAVSRIATATVVIAGPVVLYTVSPLSPVEVNAAWPTLYDKMRELVLPFSNYILPLDIATIGVVGAFLLLCSFSGRCLIRLGSGISLGVIALLFVVGPNAVKGTYLFDSRFVIMLSLLLFGAIMPAPLPRVVSLTATALFSLLLIARMAIVDAAWLGHRRDLADLRATIASVPAGARVFIATVPPAEAQHYWKNGPVSRRLSLGLPLDDHMGALLLVEHRAFWPYLFDNPSQQPVKVLSPYRELAERSGAIAVLHELAAPEGVDLCGYDDVLLLHAGGKPDLAHFAPDRLVLLAHSDIAALFRVSRYACTISSKR